MSKITSEWKLGSTVGGCMVCNALKVEAATGRYTNEISVYVISVAGQETRVCELCLQGLFIVVNSAKG